MEHFYLTASSLLYLLLLVHLFPQMLIPVIWLFVLTSELPLLVLSALKDETRISYLELPRYPHRENDLDQGAVTPPRLRVVGFHLLHLFFSNRLRLSVMLPHPVIRFVLINAFAI